MNDYTKCLSAGYVRLSVAEQENTEESLSIANQKRYIEDYCDKLGIKLVDWYVDDGYSGGNFERPGFKRLIEDIEKGNVNTVITKDISRLGRDLVETSKYLYEYFPNNNIRYISILESYDTEHPTISDDMIPFKAVLNDMFLKDTSRKIKAVRRGMMEQGLFVGSSVPYGYKRSSDNSKVFEIDEYPASIVRRIFQMRLDGMKPNMIARTLTDEGVLPPNVYNSKNIKKTFTTNLWKYSTIVNILKNEVYIGTMIQGKFERVNLKSKKKKLLPRSKWIIKKHNHIAIIDEDTFNNVNNKLKSDSNDKSRDRKYNYLLKGLVFCEDCGGTMTTRKIHSKNGNDYSIYLCSNYVRFRNGVCSMHYYREDELNRVVLSEVRNILTKYISKDKLEYVYDDTLKKGNLLKKYKDELDLYQKRLIDIDKAIGDLYRDKLSNIISTDDFLVIKSDLEKEKTKVETNIRNLTKMLDNTKDEITDKKTKEKIIKSFLKLKNPTTDDLKSIIYKITIDKDKKVRIYYNFSVNGD